MECYIAGNIPSFGHQGSFEELQAHNVGRLDTPGCRVVFPFCWLFLSQRCSNKAGIADGSAQDLKSFFAISLYCYL